MICSDYNAMRQATYLHVMRLMDEGKMITIKYTRNDGLVIQLGDHSLYFIYGVLHAYHGSFDAYLFMDQSFLPGTVRRQLNLLLPCPYVQFKSTTNIQPTTTAETLVNRILLDVAQDIVRRRLSQ